MPTQRSIPYPDGIYFITFTCFQWLPLIEKSNLYGEIYDWFDHLVGIGHYINGYCIMPNHLHVLIAFSTKERSINVEIGEGKKHLAYSIITKLKHSADYETLIELRNAVPERKLVNGQKHEVWIKSFDWKECRSDYFIRQKLDYMHDNPCAKKWKLARSPIEYPHSSASFYETGKGLYPITHYQKMEDIAFIDVKPDKTLNQFQGG
jgi:REP element-mobilizing transposase RayT